MLSANGTGPSAGVSIERLTKSFRRANGEVVVPVDDVSLDIAAGELIVLLGPSGCGKTTLLRCVAGLEEPDAGTISIRGETVFSSAKGVNVLPEHRRLGMVFQSYALWPHMTVFENVAYPLRARRLAQPEIGARVASALELVDIARLRDLKPGRLSGGQQQRVSLARALSSGDRVILFDEPLSNVDARVRETVRADLVTMQRTVGFAGIYVTHDQAEAMELADRIVILRAGKVIQIGAPREIYARPNSYYVATFVGSANEVRGTVARVAGAEVVVDTAIGAIVGRAPTALAVGQKAVAIIRPESLLLSTDEPAGPNIWCGAVEACLFAGADCTYLIKVGTSLMRVRAANPELAAPGQTAFLTAHPDRVLAFGGDEAGG